MVKGKVYRKCDAGRALTTHSFTDTVPGGSTPTKSHTNRARAPRNCGQYDGMIWYQGSHFVFIIIEGMYQGSHFVFVIIENVRDKLYFRITIQLLSTSFLRTLSQVHALCIITRKLISYSFTDTTLIRHRKYTVGQSMHTQKGFYWPLDRARVDSIASCSTCCEDNERPPPTPQVIHRHQPFQQHNTQL
jgi:hypothetical protein